MPPCVIHYWLIQYHLIQYYLIHYRLIDYRLITVFFSLLERLIVPVILDSGAADLLARHRQD